MSQKKKSKIDPALKKYIRSLMASDVGKLDLKAWQKVCQKLSPYDYDKTTRKAWFEKNKNKVPTGKEILSFTDRWAKTLRADEKLKDIKMKALREEIVLVIREAKEAQGIETGRLNTFKIATLKTLIAWASNPEKLEEGPYEGKEKLPKEKRKSKRSKWGRKAAKGTYQPPTIILGKEIERKGERAVILTIGISNNILHPYQNVELELDVGQDVTVKRVEPYSFVPSKNLIRIGFMETTLDTEPLESEIKVTLIFQKMIKSLDIRGIVHYDNTERGVREQHELKKRSIKLY